MQLLILHIVKQLPKQKNYFFPAICYSFQYKSIPTQKKKSLSKQIIKLWYV